MENITFTNVGFRFSNNFFESRFCYIRFNINFFCWYVKISRQGNVLFVNSPIIRPHLGRYREVSRSDEPHIALFISDVHLGSSTFQDREWDKFISWLNGDLDYHKEWIPNPGYLVIAGDAVDGIDSYPGQEEDLSITDVWEQYAQLSKSINKSDIFLFSK